MPSTLINGHLLRKDYSRIGRVVDIPNLIEVQMRSFSDFLQLDKKPEAMEDVGLLKVLKSIFPIKDYSEAASLDFVKYVLLQPKYTIEECIEKGITYAAPMKIVVRLTTWDKDAETGAQSVRDIKEQEVYFGEIPLMTSTGSFIVNGTERVIVSQLHRSPGVFFEYEKGKGYSGKLQFTARVIPYTGSWLDFEFDQKDLLYVRIDKRRKMLATVLLKALGYSIEEMLNYFYPCEDVFIDGKKISKSIDTEHIVGQKAGSDIKDPKTGEVIIKKDRKITRLIAKKFGAAGIKQIPVEAEDIIGRVVSQDIVDPGTGEVVIECNQVLTRETLDEISKRKIEKFKLLYIEAMGRAFRETLINDRIGNEDIKPVVEYRNANPNDSVTNMTLNARIEIYKRLKPGEPPTVSTSTQFLESLFFDAARYDLSRVGRLKLNRKIGIDTPLTLTTLKKEDIMGVVKYLLGLKNGQGAIDDIDHLGNRRVRSVGELLENQYRVGLLRLERAVKERMSLGEIETLMPNDLINPKPVTAVVKEFFGSSQLSQFMDQTNPLSEITHKRRLSALGAGGLTRERAGFEVRDVHTTHYGRICPIETPEGPNIGLIVSLSTYARVNDFGFIETPYRKVLDGKVTNRTVYLSALDEEEHIIAQANAPMDETGRFTSEFISARKAGEFVMAKPDEITLMDVSPNQLVSVAAALIPFLENDDANRALMGSNMQRQAVPLISTEAPLVGTGMESVVAMDSGVTTAAKRAGTVENVDSTRIVVRASGGDVDIYNLTKFRRSNQNTCLNQKPLVREGDKIEAKQVIADGPSTANGELALGKNVVVAFMPWGGYNFEDSILINERLLKDDVFTSVHIEEFETVARDIKLGKEEITRDIPNVGDEALKNLDESGIVCVGAEVVPGDILVGKITPKGETQFSPEEKLLRAIFGEKAEDVKDTSLRVPPGIEGVVIDAKVFSRKGSEKDDRAKSIEERETARLVKDRDDEISIVKSAAFAKAERILKGKKSGVRLADKKGNTILSKGTVLTKEILDELSEARIREIIPAGEEKAEEDLKEVFTKLDEQVGAIKHVFSERIARLKRGDELPPGVIKMVKVYIAMKRKISVGDKMAGRHGNKGVISRILPEEDMPFMKDGRPVDMVLNPLGVPSRMNIGQILETHIGWAARKMGEDINAMLEAEYSPNSIKDKIKKYYGTLEFSKFINTLSDDEVLEVARRLGHGIFISTPVFDGAVEADVKSALDGVGLGQNGKMTLYDGRTGDQFDQDVTVGIMYMLKLHHLVDDKIHARSTGPYSLVTQQPLGGKAQFGGQRLGEMEVWAMEAYGAANCLQEFLTVKSDDVPGRTKMYESIVRGDYTLEPTMPESFSVLIKEMQSLGLDVNLMDSEE